MSNHKICSGRKCRKLFQLTNDFWYEDKTNEDGFSSLCKLCINKHKLTKKEYDKKYREKFPWKNTYHHIMHRCNNPKCKDYKDYGLRGIKALITEEEIKELWFRDKAYEMKKPTIDRIDNDGHYCLENCRFIENSENVAKDKKKIVLQYDLQGNFIKEWESTTFAGKQLNVGHRNIASVCRGERKTASGFIWKYK